MFQFCKTVLGGILLLILQGCSASFFYDNLGSQSSTGSIGGDETQGSSGDSLVNSVEINNGVFTIKGKNLNKVTIVSVKETSSTTKTPLKILTQSESEIKAGATSLMKFVSQGIYQLVLSRALADEYSVIPFEFEVANGSIVTGKLADGAVASAKIADGAVISSKLAEGVVQTKHLSSLGASGGEFLKYVAGSGWQPTVLGSASTMNVGTTAGSVASGDHTHVENDPKVGVLQNGKWCKANGGGQIDCTFDAPASGADSSFGNLEVVYRHGFNTDEERQKVPWTAADVLANPNKTYQWIGGPPFLQDTQNCNRGPQANHKIYGYSGLGRYSVTFGELDGGYAAIFGSYEGQYLTVLDPNENFMTGSSINSTGNVRFILVYLGNRWAVFRMSGQTDNILFACRL